MNITQQANVKNPLISIVTGTYNRLKLLQGLFATTRANIPAGIPYEFVINDNGSTDGTLEWLRGIDDVTLIESGELVGGLRAFTDAGHAARGKYVLLANDDVAFVGEDSILAALLHLENNLNCGAVAFYDDRPVEASGARKFHVLQQPARDHTGKKISVVYAQVGMYRRWLGNLAGWWGADDPAFTSRTYGGDNYLTSRILEMGYSVDAVEATRVHDEMVADELRKLTGGDLIQTNQHPDTRAYLERYPQGPIIAPKPTVENPDKRQLRVLYVPIYGHPLNVSQKYKKGLRNALAKHFIVVEYDYVGAIDNTHNQGAKQKLVLDQLSALIRRFQPDLLLTQIHDTETITAQTLAALRVQHPRMVVANWNGDYWEKGLTSAPIMGLLKHVDLQLTVNGSVLATYKERGVPAAYWQVAFEESIEPYTAKVHAHDVVFMGNNYSRLRTQLVTLLRDMKGVNVGVYGRRWEPIEADGDSLYHFPMTEAILLNSKLTVGDNQYPDGYGYVSNRLFQTLAAGGALLLHQEVPGLEALTGIKDGVHYIAWTDFDDLRVKVDYWLDDKRAVQRKKIAKAGQKVVLEHHSFDARVRELFKLLPMARRVPDGYVTLEYKGARAQFGVTGPMTTRQYLYTPGKLFIVAEADARAMMRRDANWFEPRLYSNGAAHNVMQES